MHLNKAYIETFTALNAYTGTEKRMKYFKELQVE